MKTRIRRVIHSLKVDPIGDLTYASAVQAEPRIKIENTKKREKKKLLYREVIPKLINFND